jgi:YidC/Oxa1 family membrane protein insertase
MAKKMEELKPHLDRLSKKHKDDKKRLQEEQLKLYKQMGINPAAGCLFAIIQMPIFIALYNVLSIFLLNGGVSKTKIVDQINKIVYIGLLKITSINPWFFGFNLGVAPAHYHKFGTHYLIIPVITAFLQYLQITLSTPKASSAKTAIKITEKKSEGKEDSEDMQKIMSTQMKFMFPLMIGWFSYSLPIGLSLYWNIFSIFSIIQYKKIRS